MASKEFLEREMKWGARLGSLPKFVQLGEALGGRFILGAGADTYWTNPEQPLAAPVRHRYSQGYGELTTKAQTIPGDNTSRREVNVRLDDAQLREIEAMLPMLGYKPALRISKVSHIYECDYVVLSWYGVMTMDGRILTLPNGELAQFVEVELNEELDWVKIYNTTDMIHIMPTKGIAAEYNKASNVEQYCAWILQAWGMHLWNLGIVGPRVRRSLWEMFGPNPESSCAPLK